MHGRWLFLSLAGCPYVFGPADLSYVDGAVDSGAGVAGPEIRALAVQPRADGLHVALELVEPGGFATGSVVATLDGQTFEIAAPGDFLTWDGARATFVLAIADPCVGADDGLDVQLVSDSDGPGPVFAAVVRFAGFGTVAESVDGDDFGALDPPFVVCGAIDGDADFDRIEFQVREAGPHTVTTTWSSTGDVDFFFRADGEAVGGGYGYQQPEVLETALEVGTSYEVIVQFYGGVQPPRWLVEVAPTLEP